MSSTEIQGDYSSPAEKPDRSSFVLGYDAFVSSNEKCSVIASEPSFLPKL